MRLDLEPTTVHARRWIVDWDPVTGVLSGPAAEEIQAIINWGEVALHPHPMVHQFSREPLRSLQDMAAICGWEHRLPPELAAHYPMVEPEQGPEGLVY